MPGTPRTSPDTRPHLVMLVSNGVTTDSRVLKSAESAVGSGYRVTVVGLRSRATLAMGQHGTALVYRATLDGQHHRSATRMAEWRDEGRVDVTLPDGGTTSLVLHRGGPLAGRGRRLRRRLLGRSASWRGWRFFWPFAVDYELAFLGALLELEPDLVHCHDYHPMAAAADYAALQARAGRRVPWVYDAHEFLPGQVLPDATWHRGWVAVEKEFIGRADAVVTVIEEIAEKLRRRHRLRELPTVVRNAPLGRFVPLDPAVRRPLREECGLGEVTPLLVYVGGLTEARGILTMIEALRHLPEAHLAFVCLPDPTFIARMQQVASAHDVADRMHLVPYVPAESVSWYVSSASVGLSALVPSSSHDAAVPTKLREYLHGRVPLVVSDLPAQAAFVRDHGLGETFTPGDPASLAAAVRTVLADRDSYRARITDDLLARNTWEREAEELVRLWHRLLPVPASTSTPPLPEAVPVRGSAPAPSGRTLAVPSGARIPASIAEVWRSRCGPTLELREDPPASLKDALRRWVALETDADAVLIPAGQQLLGGYLPRGVQGEVAELRSLGIRPGLYCGSRALLSSAELVELVRGHPASSWPEDFRGAYDRQARHVRQAFRDAAAPAFTTSWLTAQAVDGVHWVPTIVPVQEPGDRDASSGDWAASSGDWATSSRLRVLVLPGMRSPQEIEVLTGLENAVRDLPVDVLRPTGRGFDPAAAASAHVVVSELVAADTTPALAYALASGAVIVGSAGLEILGIPAVQTGPGEVLDRLHDLLASGDSPEVNRLRRDGLEFARTHHTGAAAEAVRCTLFPPAII